MKFLRLILPLFLLTLTAFDAAAQTTQVTAEAINTANLRAEFNVESDLVGTISSGTRYPVLGRSEFYPWLLLGDPATAQPIGWVFDSLLTVYGDPFSVPVSTLVVGAPTPQPTAAATLPAVVQTSTTPEASDAATATPVSSVFGRVQAEINVRYGPGTEYERVGVANAGDTFPITARHTQMPWVQVAYPDTPNGFAWILVDLLEIEGDLNSVPIISQTTFLLPTLPPTPNAVQRAAIGEISPEFAQLGEQLWNRMLEYDFDPQTSRFGGLFLLNLQTGEALAFEEDIAFSGMSINKIAILTALFGEIGNTPDDATAVTIAEAMICSENISTNEMLALIGDGNPYTGADRVSAFLQQAGLNNTYIYTPFANDPFITPQAPQTRVTDADQTSAQPDPYNQLTVSEVGTLLQDLYTCATDETGALIENFDGAYNAVKCRKILEVMSHNRIGNFMEAGVPADTFIAHKHGWINDTHGDAALVLSPGGDYVFVMALHSPDWLEFAASEAVIEEGSRDVYNYFNPTAPLPEVRPPDVPPECNLLGSPAIDNLLSSTFGTEPLN